MKVRELMTKSVSTCEPNTNLAAAAIMMLDSDCGILPVVGSENKLLGVLTDRDITIALATKGKMASEVFVHEVVQDHTDSCAQEDDMKRALEIMADGKVRRLPVVNEEGVLQGIISINDAIGHVQPGTKKGLSETDVLMALKSICGYQSTIPDQTMVH
ncbi:MAG: inosine-5-monophosphate dehydrogenase [Nitrospirales bacterium]|nr:MAG: inosine-5-monophosphate dehydrogenase [Nitrospirales bacterium]